MITAARGPHGHLLRKDHRPPSLPPGWELVGEEWWRTADDAALSVQSVRYGDSGKTTFCPDVHWSRGAQKFGTRARTVLNAIEKAEAIYAGGSK